MKAISNALILEKDEFRHRGQYRISVSHFPKSFPKGSRVKVEMISIDNGERVLVVLSQAQNQYEEGAHVITARGQVTFTPPKGMLQDTSSRYERKYKTAQTQELDFQFN